MHSQIKYLVDHLKYLKKEGVERISVSEENLKRLKIILEKKSLVKNQKNPEEKVLKKSPLIRTREIKKIEN